MHDSAACIVPPVSAEERIRQDMAAPNILPALITIFAAWAIGVFLVMPRHDQIVRREIRLFGGFLVGMSLVALAVFFGTRPESWPKPQLGWDEAELRWWPESELQNPASAATFLVFASGSIVSALFGVFANQSARCLRWFALFLICTSGLLAFHNALIPSAAGLIGACAIFGLTRRKANSSESRLSAESAEPNIRDSKAGGEPALTSITGFLLATSLVGTVSYAMLHESGAAGMKSGRSRLAVGFPTAVGTAESARAANSPRQSRESGGWASLFSEYWILPAAVSALVICAVSGFVLLRQTSESLETEDHRGRNEQIKPPAANPNST